MFLNCGVGEDSLESPLDCKEIQPVHPKGDQSWLFIGRTDAEAQTPILWLPDAESWLIWKDLDSGKDWGQEEKVTTEDEMVGWHHRLNGHGFGWTPGVGDGQGSLVCCGSWSRKEWDVTERLNWTELMYFRVYTVHIHLLPAKVLVDAHGTIIWLPANTPVSFKCYVDIILNYVCSSPNHALLSHRIHFLCFSFCLDISFLSCPPG